MNIPESAVMQSAGLVLDAYGFLYTRNNVGAFEIRPGQFYRFGTAGWSDFIGMTHDGRFLAIECKHPGGRLSKLQKDFLDLVNREKGVGMVVDNIDSLLNQLKERGVI